jgi:hypothetical protein
MGRATYQAVHERNLGAGHERLAHALLADEAHIERSNLHGANEELHHHTRLESLLERATTMSVCNPCELLEFTFDLITSDT